VSELNKLKLFLVFIALVALFAQQEQNEWVKKSLADLHNRVFQLELRAH
jgi:hypothetical protein